MPHFSQAHDVSKGSDWRLTPQRCTHWKPENLLSREPRYEEIFHNKLFSCYKLLFLLCACITTGHLHITDTNCRSAQLREWDNCVSSKEVNWAVVLSDLPKAIHEVSKLPTEPRSPRFLSCPTIVSALHGLAGYCNSAEHLLSWPSELLLTKLCSGQSTLPHFSLANLNLEFSIIVSTAE